MKYDIICPPKQAFIKSCKPHSLIIEMNTSTEIWRWACNNLTTGYGNWQMPNFHIAVVSCYNSSKKFYSRKCYCLQSNTWHKPGECPVKGGYDG